jgi:hypothetical protein
MPMTRELEKLLEQLHAEGTVTVADLKVIVHAMGQSQDASVSPALSGPYWEARHRALDNGRARVHETESE